MQSGTISSAKLNLVKNTLILALGKFSSQIIIFLMLPLYTRYLDPNEYGSVDLVVTYAALLAPTLTIQMEMAVFRHLIEERYNPDGIRKILSNALSIIFATSSFWILIAIISNRYLKMPNFYLVISIVLAAIFSGFLMQSARGLGRNIDYAIASIITGTVTVVANIVLVVNLGLGAKGMLISLLISYIIPILYLTYSLRVTNYIALSSLEKTTRKKLIRYSAPLVPNAISWWVINAADRTIILFFIGLNANGVYAVSTKFALIYSSIFAIFSMSWTESASLHIKDANRNQYFSSTIDSALRFFGSIGLLIIAVVPFVFPFFVANRFQDAFLYIPLLLMGAVFNSIVGLYGGIYVALKKTGKVATTSIVSMFISLVVNLAFIRAFGLFAAASAGTIAFLAMAFYRNFDIRRFVEVRFRPSTLIFLIVGYALIIFVYYRQNLWFDILGLFLAMLFAVLLNRREIFTLSRKSILVIRTRFLSSS